MKICNLGSGSSGNATLIDTGTQKILIDNGFSIKELSARLQRTNYHPEEITAILLTHYHNDHLQGAGPWARRFKIPVYTTRSVIRYYSKKLNRVEAVLFYPGESFSIDAVRIYSIPLPHDAKETVGFVIEHQNQKYTTLTDLGSIPEDIYPLISDTRVLMLECNHDLQMLRNGPYHYELKVRIESDTGHLSNKAASDFLQTHSFTSELKSILLGHLSRENNTPELALKSIKNVVKKHPIIDPQIIVTNQSQPTSVIEI